MARKKKKAAAAEITTPIVRDYEPTEMFLGEAHYNWRNRPIFHRFLHVPVMLADSRVNLAMMVLKGMITSLTKVYIDEGNGDADQASEIKQFLIPQIERFWRVAANRLLTSLEWGYYGAETLYGVNQRGQYVFNDLQDFQQPDVKPVTLDGQFCGIELERGSNQRATDVMARYIGGQKAFWHVHGRHQNKWFGKSRLKGAFDPWLDLHMEGGGMDVRRLYYYKNVFQSETIYHPPGSHVDENGKRTPWADITRSLVEKLRAGGVMCFPSIFDPNGGKRLFEVEDRRPSGAGTDCREYVTDLRMEITEGLGLPEEVFQAADTGSGYSGRKIPEQAARGMLTEIVYWMLTDADRHIFRPLCRKNFRCEPEYELIPFGLVEDSNGAESPVEVPGSNIPGQTLDKAASRQPGQPLRMAF